MSTKYKFTGNLKVENKGPIEKRQQSSWVTFLKERSDKEKISYMDALRKYKKGTPDHDKYLSFKKKLGPGDVVSPDQKVPGDVGPGPEYEEERPVFSLEQIREKLERLEKEKGGLTRRERDDIIFDAVRTPRGKKGSRVKPPHPSAPSRRKPTRVERKDEVLALLNKKS